MDIRTGCWWACCPAAGRDLMAAKGRPCGQRLLPAPHMRAWFVESTLYPFIGRRHYPPACGALGPRPDARRSTMILPYAFHRSFRESAVTGGGVPAVSCACLESARDVLLGPGAGPTGPGTPATSPSARLQ
ncbi:MAG: hypothetical protein ACLR0P_00415 [Oscillospiraceae bacterium]